MFEPPKPHTIAALVAASALVLSGCSGARNAASLPSEITSGSASSDAASGSVEPGSTSASGQAASGAAPAAPATAAPAWSAVAPAILRQLKSVKTLTVSGSSGKGEDKVEMNAKGEVSTTGDYEVSMKQEQNQLVLKIIRAGGTLYTAGSPAAFGGILGDDTGAKAKLIGDKYLRASGEMVEKLGTEFNLTGLRDELVKTMPAASTKMTAKIGDYAGSPAFVYTNSTVKVYVATDGTHRPLGYEEISTSRRYVLSEWDQDYALAEPDPSQVVTVEELDQAAQQ